MSGFLTTTSQQASFNTALPRTGSKVSLPFTSVERLLDTDYSVLNMKMGPTSFEHLNRGFLSTSTNILKPFSLRIHSFAPNPKRERPGLAPVDGDFNQSQMKNIDLNSDSPLSLACNSTAVTPLCLRTLYGQYDSWIVYRIILTFIQEL